MFTHEILARDLHSERLRQAQEARFARHAAELSRLRQVRQRAERRLRQVALRVGELHSAISALS
jgi:hypothetical protein